MIASQGTARMVRMESSRIRLVGGSSRFFSTALFSILFVAIFSLNALAVQTANSGFEATDSPGENSPDSQMAGGTDAASLFDAQQRIAERYRLLEDKLFTLYEYERDQNPMRSKMLKRAYQQSQEKMTTTHLNTIVGLLANQQLKEAEQHQKVVLKELEDLLTLLESEDRGKRVRDEIRRHQEYLKEVERILRMQKGLRAQAENHSDSIQIGTAQGRTADRTKELADEIKQNEEAPDTDAGDPQAVQSADKSPSDDIEGSEGSRAGDGEPSETEPAPGQPPNSDSQNPPTQGPPTDRQPGSDDSSGTQDQENSRAQNPVREKVQAAEQRMRSAQEKLDKASRENAIDDMRAAEEELAAARKELEEILRQLRKEEVERTLAMLETRFRQMLERELRVYDKTRSLDQIAAESRNTDFEIQTGKVSIEQKSIAMECERALLLLREDGSSVAFPETVDQLYQDMLQVADRLSAANTGRITIQLEEDVLESLEYLIQALVTTQKDLESLTQNPAGSPGQGQPGEKPLVDSLAEIKMLRGLQERIYARHQRYSKLLNNPDDAVGSTDDPDLRAALERLSLRQQQLTDIARDLVVGKNQ